MAPIITVTVMMNLILYVEDGTLQTTYLKGIILIITFCEASSYISSGVA